MPPNFIKNYLDKIKNINIALSVLFFISIIAGYILAENNPEKIEKIFIENLKDMLEPALKLPSLKLFEFIFLKNLATAIIAVLSGIIFGIIPILIIFINGLILGIVSFIFLREFGAIALLSGLAPHGIFEIPALIFSAASGVWLWRSIYRRIIYEEKTLASEFKLIIKFFIFAIIPLLFFAALIESFATPAILSTVKSFFNH
ncbi:stage II sporulation protein M [Patescibacteria group bacterium]|nr:stage II sporulation protein M [Patescibacteria group bacterium]